MGQIVKHLTPVTLPAPDEKAVARVAVLVKSPRVLIATAVAAATAAAFGERIEAVLLPGRPGYADLGDLPSH